MCSEIEISETVLKTIQSVWDTYYWSSFVAVFLAVLGAYVVGNLVLDYWSREDEKSKTEAEED